MASPIRPALAGSSSTSSDIPCAAALVEPPTSGHAIDGEVFFTNESALEGALREHALDPVDVALRSNDGSVAIAGEVMMIVELLGVGPLDADHTYLLAAGSCIVPMLVRL